MFLILLFAIIINSKAEEYSVNELINFHSFGIGVTASYIIPQKTFIRNNYYLDFPYCNPVLNFNFKASKNVCFELGLSYQALHTSKFDTLTIEIPEASISCNYSFPVMEANYLEFGIGGGFSALLASANVETINPSKIKVGKRELSKIKYGYHLLGLMNYKFYINEQNCILAQFKYKFSQIGDPTTNGLGNLGGINIGIGYLFYF